MVRDQTSRSAISYALRSVLFATGMWTLAYVLVVHDLGAQAAPRPPSLIEPFTVLADRRPLIVTVTRNWKKVQFESTPDELTASPAIWMDMHFGDWDRLPADVSERGLVRLRHRFRGVVAGPDVWTVMSAADWDAVPQPVRMVVFPLMVEYWVDYYALGRVFQLPDSLVSDTVSAIVMAESWFQHRADVVNQWGNRDVGLGQCSNRCRRDLRRMADVGRLDFSLDDDDYLSPWHATRAAVVWFGLELARAEGDVDLAIRAYNRGFKAAERGDGEEYAHNVRRLRAQYFAGPTQRSATWERLVTWARSVASAHTAPSQAWVVRRASPPATELPHPSLGVQLSAEQSTVKGLGVFYESDSASRAAGRRTR